MCTFTFLIHSFLFSVIESIIHSNMCRLQKNRSILSLFIFSLIFITFNIPSVCIILHVREGEEAKLNFSYPCDITKTTLQHSHKAPFYNSENPDSNTLPPWYGLENQKKSDNDSTCFILLIIDPVSRNDEGTFILFVYNHSQLLPEYPRIGLRVAYPPGKASCFRSDVYLEGEWISLHCSAPPGNLPGQILCYQHGLRLPPLTRLSKLDGTLQLTILARQANHSVHCCSTTLEQVKHNCECNDSGWDPIQNGPITKTPNLCPLQLLVRQPTTTESPSRSQVPTTQTANCTGTLRSPTCVWAMSWKRICLIISTCFFALMTVALAILFRCKVRENKMLSKKLHVNNTTTSGEQQNLRNRNPDELGDAVSIGL